MIQTFRYALRPVEFLRECAERYGSMFTLRFPGGENWVYLTRPEQARALLAAAPGVALAGVTNRAAFGALVGDGAGAMLDGEAYADRRRLIDSPFHGERVVRHVDGMVAAAHEAIDGWPLRRAFSLLPSMREVTRRVMLGAVFGLDGAPGGRRLGEAVERLTSLGLSSPLLVLRPLQVDLGPWSPWGRVVRAVRAMDEALFEEMARRRAAGTEGRHDILSRLIEARTPSGEGLSDREIRDELMVALFAGHETAALSLAWVFALVLSHPRVLSEVRAELGREAGDGALGQAQLDRLSYLDAVLLEALRLRPITPNASNRCLARPLVIGGHELPAGTRVSICTAMLQRDPAAFERPDEFVPERFVGQRPPAYSWVPFGGGGRRCPGMSFALLEMKAIVAAALGRAELQVVRGRGATGRSGFFVAPEGGLRVELLGRRPAPARLAPGPEERPRQQAARCPFHAGEAAPR